jgi:Domain of unknown function (DUF5666)
MKNRLLFIVLAVLLAVSASAQMRMHPSTPPNTGSNGMGMDTGSIMNGAMPGAIVSGKVENVGGTTITLASSLVTIDAAQATIVVDGKKTTVASIQSGDFIVATLKTAAVSAGMPLPATVVAVARQAAVAFVGDVQAVDQTSRTLTILGRTVSVDGNTAFGGPFAQKSLADVVVGANAIVAANVAANVTGVKQLVATNVMVMGMLSQQPPMGGQPKATLLRGIVERIAADNWVITTTTGDITVLVNTQTKIVGNPKVGDKVDVMATTDSANKYVALAIMKSIF